jgi:lysylphosphatidylglycerol synthetase-like protein (DUF2156 family)
MIAATVLISIVHLAWVVLVIFGARWTRGRSQWSAAHILALLSGIATQINLFPCPLTLAEQYCETRAGLSLYRERFLVHYLNLYVSPGIPAWLITAVGVAVCVFNLGIYLWRFRNYACLSRPSATTEQS